MCVGRAVVPFRELAHAVGAVAGAGGGVVQAQPDYARVGVVVAGEGGDGVKPVLGVDDREDHPVLRALVNGGAARDPPVVLEADVADAAVARRVETAEGFKRRGGGERDS